MPVLDSACLIPSFYNFLLSCLEELESLTLSYLSLFQERTVRTAMSSALSSDNNQPCILAAMYPARSKFHFQMNLWFCVSDGNSEEDKGSIASVKRLKGPLPYNNIVAVFGNASEPSEASGMCNLLAQI